VGEVERREETNDDNEELPSLECPARGRDHEPVLFFAFLLEDDVQDLFAIADHLFFLGESVEGSAVLLLQLLGFLLLVEVMSRKLFRNYPDGGRWPRRRDDLRSIGLRDN